MGLLLRGAIKDPGARGVVVHAVRVSGDLRHARVWIRLGEPGTVSDRQRAAVGALERASGFLRRELGARLGLRYTPELQFAWDESADHAARVEVLLGEIRREEGRAAEVPGDAARPEQTATADHADPVEQTETD
jgi:ribosome-binding factor A